MKKFLTVLALLLVGTFAEAQGGYTPAQPKPPQGQNNTWTGTNAFLDNKFTLVDEADPLKIFSLQVSGLTQARTFGVPDFNGQFLTTGGIQNLSAEAASTFQFAAGGLSFPAATTNLASCGGATSCYVPYVFGDLYIAPEGMGGALWGHVPTITITGVSAQTPGGGQTCDYYAIIGYFGNPSRASNSGYIPLAVDKFTYADCPLPANFNTNPVTVQVAGGVGSFAQGKMFSIVRVDASAPNTCKEFVFENAASSATLQAGFALNTGSLNFTWTCNDANLDSFYVGPGRESASGGVAANTQAVMAAPAGNGGVQLGTYEAPLNRVVAMTMQMAPNPTYMDAKPTCEKQTRGLIWFVAGATGVADTYEICRKDNVDAFAWTSLY